MIFLSLPPLFALFVIRARQAGTGYSDHWLFTIGRNLGVMKQTRDRGGGSRWMRASKVKRQTLA